MRVAAAAVIWGSNGVIVNWVPLNPYVIAFFRVLFASLFLLPLLLLTQRREMVEAAKAWRSMLFLGALLSLGWGFLFQSMKLIAITNAVLLNYTAPIFVALLAPLFLKERIERITILALATSMVGMIMISYQQDLQASSLNLSGVAFGLFASLAYACFIILSKKVVVNHSTQAVALCAYSASMVFLSPSLIGVNLSMDLASWILLVVLGVCNTAFAVTIYLNGLRSIEAQKAVIFTYLEPVSTAVFGYLFLAQQPTLRIFIGGFLIVFAGYIVASK
ncbi:MAG: DMT family transporter [Candidatus Bathyarchaeia archaeon]